MQILPATAIINHNMRNKMEVEGVHVSVPWPVLTLIDVGIKFPKKVEINHELAWCS